MTYLGCLAASYMVPVACTALLACACPAPSLLKEPLVPWQVRPWTLTSPLPHPPLNFAPSSPLRPLQFWPAQFSSCFDLHDTLFAPTQSVLFLPFLPTDWRSGAFCLYPISLPSLVPLSCISSRLAAASVSFSYPASGHCRHRGQNPSAATPYSSVSTSTHALVSICPRHPRKLESYLFHACPHRPR